MGESTLIDKVMLVCKKKFNARRRIWKNMSWFKYNLANPWEVSEPILVSSFAVISYLHHLVALASKSSVTSKNSAFLGIISQSAS